MPETTSWKTFRDRCLRYPDRGDRVENRLMSGMPDFNCTINGVDAWIEIKTISTEPKREDSPLIGGQNHPLSLEQRNWLKSHARAGGRGFVYIDSPTRRYLISGVHADRVNSATIAELMLMAEWTCNVPTSASRWNELRMVIRGH